MEDIPSYFTDNEEDVSNRLIKQLNSLPYLVIKKDENFLDIENLLQSYKKNFSDFITEYNLPIEHIETYIKLWLYYNKESSEEKFLEYPKLKEIIKSFKLSFDPTMFKQKQKNDFIDNLKKLKKDFKIKVEKNDLIHTTIKDTKEQKYLDFKKQKYIVYFMTCINNLSLGYIFNMIECNENIPFASYDSICKMYNNFTSVKHVENYKDKIILKIKVNDIFIDSFLILDKNLSLKIEINIDTSIFIDFKEYIKSIFKIPLEFGENFDEHDIYGVFIFPNQKFNKYILSDMIMNDPTISKFLAVDESIKASTKKTGLLTKFKGNDIKDSSCNIICKKVIKNDIELKGLDKKKFPIGSYYTKVRISKFNNIKNIELFITLLSKFLTIYHQNEKNVYEEYKSFLGQSFMLAENDIEEVVENTIEDIVPELFVSGYRRICSEDRHPIIIDEDETKNLEEYKDYIKFPKDTDYCYQCKSKKYPYIGLLSNTLSNMNKYEYIPCCYKKIKHNIEAYYFKEDDNIILKKQQNIIKTLDRLLDEGHYGEIPKNLNTFLISLYNDNNYSFYRKGISKTKHSFLECILQSLNVKNIPVQNFYIASQENPDLTLVEMKQKFENKNTYLDPRRWIKLLEYTYKCNIHVFSRNDKNKDCDIVIPFHIPPYLKYESTYDKTVIILENENSRTKEIRCELIVTELKDKYTNFFSNDSIKTQIKQFYLTLDNKKPLIKYSLCPMNFDIQFSYQVLDTSKKTRCIVTSNNIFLLCDPIPPLDLPIKTINNFESEYNNVKELFDIDINQSEIKVGMFTILLKRDRPYKNDLLIYKNNKKIATILGEFFIYVYSTYLKENNLKISIESIKSFIDYHVIIKETTYKVIPSSIINREIMITHGYLNSDEKILVSNNETLKRLICLLRLRIINSINDVISYHKKFELMYFYKSINDFNSFSNIIIYSTDLYKIENIKQIVYTQFQYLDVYYLYFDKKIFIVKSIDKISYDIDYYINFYDENLILIDTKGNKKDIEMNLIQYEESYTDEYNKKKKIKKYQHMITL